MSEELEREVLIMCNLSQGVKAEGKRKRSARRFEKRA